MEGEMLLSPSLSDSPPKETNTAVFFGKQWCSDLSPQYSPLAKIGCRNKVRGNKVRETKMSEETFESPETLTA